LKLQDSDENNIHAFWLHYKIGTLWNTFAQDI
jgi:hypothetical protein